jgi:hypothetical protein
MQVYNLGRGILAFVIMLLASAPFYGVMGMYAVGVGAVVGIVFLAVSGALNSRDAGPAGNAGAGMCGILTLIAVGTFIAGGIALVRHVGRLWDIIGAGIAVLTVAYAVACLGWRTLPRTRLNARRQRLARQMGWRYLAPDAALTTRVRRLFPEFGDAYGTVQGVVQGVGFTMATVRPALRARGQVWLFELPVRWPTTTLTLAGTVAGGAPVPADLIERLRRAGVRELRIDGTNLGLLTKRGAAQEQAPDLAAVVRSLPAPPAHPDPTPAAAPPNQPAAVRRTTGHDDPLRDIYAKGMLLGLAEIICGVLATVFDGFLPFGAIIIAAGIGFAAVAWIGDDHVHKLPEPTTTGQP